MDWKLRACPSNLPVVYHSASNIWARCPCVIVPSWDTRNAFRGPRKKAGANFSQPLSKFPSFMSCTPAAICVPIAPNGPPKVSNKKYWNADFISSEGTRSGNHKWSKVTEEPMFQSLNAEIGPISTFLAKSCACSSVSPNALAISLSGPNIVGIHHSRNQRSKLRLPNGLPSSFSSYHMSASSSSSSGLRASRTPSAMPMIAV